MQKARAHGLVFNLDGTIDGDENQAVVHDSFKDMAGGIYRICKLFRPFYRVIGAAPSISGQSSTDSINETIDASVFDRWRNVPAYRPQNLANWARKRGVDPPLLFGPVFAHDAKPLACDVRVRVIRRIRNKRTTSKAFPGFRYPPCCAPRDVG